MDSEDDESSDYETEEEKHEREKNVDDDKSQSGISVEHLPEVRVVNLRSVMSQTSSSTNTS